MARFKGSVSDFFLGEEADVHRLLRIMITLSSELIAIDYQN